ncbi:MAG: hypothetical protein JKY86_06445 [Gammaproteobacteria bacterium]|nr:hypothetical protein [Gammaproteobacteria bacterium]
MGIDKINTWLTLLANLGVLAGIVFLGIEIQQNTNMVRTQTRDNMAEKQLSWYALAGRDSKTAELYLQGQRDELEQSPEYFQYVMIVASSLAMMSNEWYQYQQGMYRPEEFEPRQFRWKRDLRSPGFRRIWSGTQQNQYAQSFRDEVNRIIEELDNEN